MQNDPKRSRLDQPAVYQIKVQGRLDASWKEWFGDMTIAVSHDKDRMTVTTMTGLVVDQVALHGLLLRIRDLGLPLLEVLCLDESHPHDQLHGKNK